MVIEARATLLGLGWINRLAFAPSGLLPATGTRLRPFALRLFARKLFRPANGLRRLARLLLGRLLIGPAAFHLTKQAFALKFLLQNPQGLINIVIANENTQNFSPSR